MAHNLFRKATAALDREKTSELWILYYGNFKGKFLVSNDDVSMGGLPRAAAVLKDIRRAVPFFDKHGDRKHDDKRIAAGP